MPLPETIPVRYTEEEAEYLSVRPVVRQTFRLHELVDMILGVTGKDLPRVQKILRAGTIVFNFYRYWWEGFEADDEELRAVLAGFPDADPARPFRGEECVGVLLESGAHPPHHSTEIARELAAQKRLFSSRSFWDELMDLARTQPPAYQDYSYSRRADIFRLELSAEQVQALVRDAQRFAPRALRVHLYHLPAAARIVFLCPRPR